MKLIWRVTKSDRTSIKSYNRNPILDTRIYKVLIHDGLAQEYTATRIALSMYDKVNSDRHRTRIMDLIGRHRSDDRSIKKSDGFLKDSKGRKKRKITTKGWDFLTRWPL